MLVKMQNNGEKASYNGILKKVYCSQHGNRYLYRCDFKDCNHPFMCHKLECIDGHFHEDNKIQMRKLQMESLIHQFKQAQYILNSQQINNSAKELKNFIDGLKSSIVTVFNDLKVFHRTCDSLRNQINVPLTLQYIDQVKQSVVLESKLHEGINKLKNKLIIEINSTNMTVQQEQNNQLQQKQHQQQQQHQHQQKQQFQQLVFHNSPITPPLSPNSVIFPMKSQLIAFLNSNILGFCWQNCRQIFSNKNSLTSCISFHQKLQGLQRLLFIFIGSAMLVGSYFHKRYPAVADKQLKDCDSFLFVGQSSKFTKFIAIDEVEYHLMLSEKVLICHGNTPSYGDGVRIFQRKFQTLDYCLPSRAYIEDDSQGRQFNDRMKIEEVLVMQITQNK